MRERQRITKVRFVLFSLLLLLSACSAGKPKSDESEGISMPDNPQRLTDEGKFIHDDSFRSGILRSCHSTQTFERRTSYGSWHKLEGCNFEFHGIKTQNKEFSIHKDPNGIIDGLRFMIHPDTEYGQHLLSRYSQYSVQHEPGICIQYYQHSFPILTIADESHCDAIKYRQI